MIGMQGLKKAADAVGGDFIGDPISRKIEGMGGEERGKRHKDCGISQCASNSVFHGDMIAGPMGQPFPKEKQQGGCVGRHDQESRGDMVRLIDIDEHFMGIDEIIYRHQIESCRKFLEEIVLNNRKIQN